MLNNQRISQGAVRLWSDESSMSSAESDKGSETNTGNLTNVICYEHGTLYIYIYMYICVYIYTVYVTILSNMYLYVPICIYKLQSDCMAA